MSFSADVKGELAKQISKSRHCQLAELAGILQMAGRVETGPLSIVLETDNDILLQKYAILMKRAFNIDITKAIGQEDSLRILSAMKWIDEKNQIKLPLQEQRTDGRLIQKTCCKRAFLRGAFLAVGSMSDPNKGYHFEIVCRNMEQAVQMQEVIGSFDSDAKIVERKGHQVVYLKEGSQIVDMLNVMEAYVSLMNLENIRILKEKRNSINRQVNCETANIAKTVNAASKQIEDIQLIQKHVGLSGLPDNLREMALVRLTHPESSLQELGGYLDPPVGKSGVNHRLRKLSEIADKIRI